MSQPIKTVAVAGATGMIGRPILNRLVSSGLFKVTVLTRIGSKHTFPASVTVKAVDYDSVESLTSALQGVDGLVSGMGFDAIYVQKNLVDAAVAAGVRRMIPSEYGNDTMNPKLATMPIYLPKIAIRKYLDGKVAANPSFSYTIVMNVSFLAPGYALDFILDVKAKKCLVKDGGDVPFCATTLEHIAQAVVGIFTHPDETANRPVKIKSVDTTQNELIAIAQSIDPSGEWQITHCRTEDLEVEAHRRWNEGDHSEEVVEMFINRAFIGKGWGGYFPETDDELLGIEMLDKKGLESIVRAAIEA